VIQRIIKMKIKKYTNIKTCNACGSKVETTKEEMFQIELTYVPSSLSGYMTIYVCKHCIGKYGSLGDKLTPKRGIIEAAYFLTVSAHTLYPQTAKFLLKAYNITVNDIYEHMAIDSRFTPLLTLFEKERKTGEGKNE
jgi:hypothetical protein